MTFETKDSGKRIDLANGMVRDTADNKPDYMLVRKGPLFQRWAELLSRGAKKYGKNNWHKSVDSNPGDAREATRARWLESAARHFEQWLAGDRSEDHAAAVIFNMNGYEAMREHDDRHATAEVFNIDPKDAPSSESFQIAADQKAMLKRADQVFAVAQREHKAGDLVSLAVEEFAQEKLREQYGSGQLIKAYDVRACGMSGCAACKRVAELDGAARDQGVKL
jgi:hypothetical protein